MKAKGLKQLAPSFDYPGVLKTKAIVQRRKVSPFQIFPHIQPPQKRYPRKCTTLPATHLYLWRWTYRTTSQGGSRLSAQNLVHRNGNPLQQFQRILQKKVSAFERALTLIGNSEIEEKDHQKRTRLPHLCSSAIWQYCRNSLRSLYRKPAWYPSHRDNTRSL